VSKVAVIGAGYVGVTSAVCFAHLGHSVVCADIDPHRVELLNAGVPPIVEHRLEELLAEGLASGRLRFVLGAANAVADAEVVFLCVPTPQGADGAADLSFVEAAVAEIGPALPYEAIVVNKSTVPVGSAKVVERVLGRPDVRVVSNPEFLREGSAIEDFLKPDRVVVGAEDQAAALTVAGLYASLGAHVVVTDPASAETIKYAANAFLATKLSFVNAIAAICEGVGADVDDVMVGLGLDRRIGRDFLRPGPGWGGSCFPKDTKALIRIADDAGYRFDLLEGVVAVNEAQFDRIADKVRSAVGGVLEGAQVAVWGLTFKARTDDLRDSPSVVIVERLIQSGAEVRIYDPTVTERRNGVPPSARICLDPYGTVDGAQVLVVLTEWDEFRWLDPAKTADLMASAQVVDARNLLDREAWRGAGFTHQGVGR
jgi:UDPglucose 6-dehydrogenase